MFAGFSLNTIAFARIVLVCLCVLLAAPSVDASEHTASQGDSISIHYPDFWPFFTRRDGKMTGFFYEIVSEALGRMDIKSEWQVYPWGRCQENVKSGLGEAMITVPTAERLEYADTHLNPFYLKELKVFTYAGHSNLPTIMSIREIGDIKKAGLTVITYVGNGWNDRHVKSRGIKTYETPKLPNVWRMLANRRGDIVIEWPGAAWPDILKSNLLGEIVETDVSLQAMPFHLLVSKKSTYIGRLAEFNQVILEMKKDGMIASIVEKYEGKH